jgi:hypothetical protein
MVSKRTNFEKAEQSNSSIKLTDTSNTEVNNINLLINKLPSIIFRASGKLSWGMDYLSSNVEELTGYSRMDFIDQKLHTLSK